MTYDDPLTLLARENPIAADQLPGPESEYGRRLKARIMLADVSERSRGSRRRTRRRQVAAAAVAAAVVVTAVALPRALSDGKLGTSPAAAALDRAANATSRSATAPAGRYAYSRAETLTAAMSTDDPPYTVLVARTTETWLAADGSGVIREGPGKLVFPGPRDRARWMADGAPQVAGHAGDQPIPADAPGLAAQARRDPDDLDAATLDALMNAPAALPADPDRLEQLVRAYAKTIDPPVESAMFNQLTELASESWGAAPLRAAAYRVLARLDGVTLAGDVRDPLGRRGVELDAPVGYTHDIGTRLIIDPRTGDVLAMQTVLLRAGGWVDAAPGAVIGQTVYRRWGWADELGEPANARARAAARIRRGPGSGGRARRSSSRGRPR
jgi:hypothetical protein